MTTMPDVRFNRTTPPHIITLILLTGVSAMSMNIFLPSLPAMTTYFDTEYRLMQLSVAIYLAMNAVLQIFLGPLADRFGRRPVLLASCVVFTLASIGCVYAPTIEIFLVFRMFQAVIVAGMVLGRAVVRDMYPQDQAASMIGYVTMGMAIVPMISPALGGLLDEAFGWQANFWALALAGAAVLALTWIDLGETGTATGVSLRDQVRQYPELLTSHRFWGYCAAAAFSSGAFFAYVGGAPFVGSVVFGLDPSTLGLLFGAPAVGYLFGNWISGRYSVRFGINKMILWGSAIALLGPVLSLISFATIGGSAYSFFGFMMFVGFGNGMVLPNATSGQLSVRPHLAGTASGLGGALMIGGGAAQSALAGTLLTPGSGAWPLLWMMLLTGTLAVASILYTMRRERIVTGG
ncbi:multidrug effflux MFS transporter [Anianabacter salinae]|uniref:multidrug effflux MFS transporter n=1 Tax=Anianabacter salinae TaxID=2851023 RepID=UPI00225E591C|nr:multidrug effflux MFS transporter [Anianabacter salinae]MBV0913934.1 multidrug effflux MFS transporter [Anianabacter salinae]